MSDTTTVTADTPEQVERGAHTLGRPTTPRLLARIGLTPQLMRFALVVFAGSRLAFIAETVLFLRLRPPQNLPAPPFFGAWTQLDAVYYARIAVDGYTPAPVARAAFFPLMPWLIHLAALPFGERYAVAYVAALVVSNLCFLGALLGLGALALHDADAATARRAILYLPVFPSALFLFAGYAESLFLALAIWCVVALRRRAWWAAGLLGLLASLTRQMGVLLVVPFLWEYGSYAGWHLRRVRADALAVLLIPGGLLIFMVWLWRTVGDPLAFIHAQALWNRSVAPPWVPLIRAIPQVLHISDRISLFRQGADFGADLLFGGLILYGIRRARPGDLLFAAAVWLVVLSFSPTLRWPLVSNARFMIEAFPCFLLLARLTDRRPWLTATILSIFAVSLLMLTEFFVRGIPIQ